MLVTSEQVIERKVGLLSLAGVLGTLKPAFLAKRTCQQRNLMPMQYVAVSLSRSSTDTLSYSVFRSTWLRISAVPR